MRRRSRCTLPRQRTTSIRLVQTARLVTAVQAHPSHFSTHVRRRRADPLSLTEPFEHTRYPKATSRSIAEATGFMATDHRSCFRRSSPRPRPLRQRAPPPRKRPEGRTERQTRHSSHPPEGRRDLCSSPSVGVRRHLPWGSLPFDGISVGDRCAPDYLPGTFRSQGFSPSQRFDPTDTSWLCFTPHPSIGFRPSELFPRSQPSRLSTRHALLSFLRRTTHRSKPMGRTCGDFRALLQLRIRHPPQRV